MGRLFMFILLITPIILPTNDVYVHFFIHGTTLPGLLFLNQQQDQDQKPALDNNYTKLAEKSRHDERFYDDSIMLEPGLVPITRNMLTQCKKGELPPDLSRKAAIQAIAAYDDFVDSAHTHVYYVYGWSGILSDECRKQEAHVLYQIIIRLKQQLERQYQNRRIMFVMNAHSHAGGVILYLAQEEQREKGGLSIEHALLYEVPVQMETAGFCTDPLFKHISLFHSEGDNIQTLDHFSTASKKCCRTFSELIDLSGTSNRINEVFMQADGDATAILHRSYFFFDAYSHTIRKHKNLLANNDAIAVIKPLPIAVFSPVFVSLLNNTLPQEHHVACTINIRVDGTNCKVHVLVPGKCQQCSANIRGTIERIKDRLAKYWQPYATTSNVKKMLWLGQHIIQRGIW